MPAPDDTKPTPAPNDTKSVGPATTLVVPPPRPPTQAAAFAASDLLRNANGYQDWVFTLCSCLPSDVLGYLQSGVPHPSWPSSYVPLWDHYARASICAAVDPRMVLPVALRMRYGAVSAVDLLPVVARLFCPEPMPDSPDAFLQFRDRFDNDSRLLADSNVTTDSLLASHLLARMPPSLSAWRITFVNSQGTSGTLPPAADILDRIYWEIKARPAEAPAVTVATPQQRAPPGPCPNPKCRQLHWLAECPNTAWAAAFRARRASTGASLRGRKKGSPAVASPAIVEMPEPTTFTACLLATPSPFHKSTWLLDSGANHHMANNSTLFLTLRSCAGPPVAGVAGSLPSTGCGSVRILTPAGPFVATDVLLVPSLPCNLLSFRRLDRLGFSISFGSGCAKISNSSGTVVATAQAIANDLYALNVAPSPCMPNALLATPHRVSLLTMHRRFAHLPVAQLKNVVQKGLVTGVDWVYSEDEVRSFNCDACLASKAHTLPFACSTSIAHCYMLVIVDDYTRKHWCILLTYKSDVFHHLRDWILEVENTTDDRVKTICSDNGGEFTLRNFVDFCLTKGIRRKLTILYTPQQNGHVERTNWTIKEGILVLLYSAGADTCLWAKAARYFVHCKNLMPHAGICGAIPDARWHGVAPDISSLRAFGCRAWHCLPSVKRTNLDPKAVPLIFVGLNDHAKVYRLFDPATCKILLSCSVVFCESEFRGENWAVRTNGGLPCVRRRSAYASRQPQRPKPYLRAAPRAPLDLMRLESNLVPFTLLSSLTGSESKLKGSNEVKGTRLLSSLTGSESKLKGSNGVIRRRRKTTKRTKVKRRPWRRAQPVATTHTGATPLPVAADIYPDQVDHSEPLLVAPPRSLAPRAELPGPAPAASDQGLRRPSPARDLPDQDSRAPPASDQGSSDSAISTPCPSPRPVAPHPLPAPPSPT
ncbi:BQ5605_C006g03784 [Microbotryum silenes-dioicae]|uniref:BQ5605_C006g03784 protein n=1 Tax=Microbotryum silenes-dioicae TaxID=796604 RepID=A0A2X0M983_9BASI|nr:BQ5605_C006g03784 [Microbotryum silenes-dioicae]